MTQPISKIYHASISLLAAVEEGAQSTAAYGRENKQVVVESQCNPLQSSPDHAKNDSDFDDD